MAIVTDLIVSFLVSVAAGVLASFLYDLVCKWLNGLWQQGDECAMAVPCDLGSGNRTVENGSPFAGTGYWAHGGMELYFLSGKDSSQSVLPFDIL